MITQYSDIIARLEKADWLIPTLARIVFVLVFLVYFLNSASLKIDGSIFSPSSGAFGQIFPKAAEAVLWDVSKMTIFQRVVIFAGTLAEFVLPVLILLGLFTRLAALGLVGFTIVQTMVDVNGHGVKLGSWLNNAPELIDTRTLWVFLFVVIFVKGAGPLSLDRVLSMIFFRKPAAA